MRFATLDELHALFAEVPLQSIVHARDGMRDIRPQDRAIHDAQPAWMRALDQASPHCLDDSIAHPLKKDAMIPARAIGVVFEDVQAIFTRAQLNETTAVVYMHVVEPTPDGSWVVKPMRSVAMEACALFTNPALAEACELRESSSPGKPSHASTLRV